MTETDPFANIPNADDSWNGEYSPASIPAPKSDDALNWEALRIVLTEDERRWRAPSTSANDYWAGRADAAQLILESMLTLERYEVPGLTEHTEAAPAYEPKCGDRVTGPRGLATVVDTASFGNASKVEYDEPHRYVIELNGHLSPAEGTAGYLQALAEHTEAACDTITRAAQ